MKIIKTYNWHRRDFSYDAECENCKAVSKNNYGYDDWNYYNNVVPITKCKECGKCSNDLGKQKEFTEPRHNPNLVM